MDLFFFEQIHLLIGLAFFFGLNGFLLIGFLNKRPEERQKIYDQVQEDRHNGA
jgi:hypothetical protein